MNPASAMSGRGRCDVCQLPLPLLCINCHKIKNDEQHPHNNTVPTNQHLSPHQRPCVDAGHDNSLQATPESPEEGNKWDKEQGGYATPPDTGQVQSYEEGRDCSSQASLLPSIKSESGGASSRLDMGETEVSEDPPQGKKRQWRRGRPCKYGLDTTTCSLCHKTLSTRKALIWHLFTQHNTKVPGAEHLIEGRLLTDRKRGIKKRQHLHSHADLPAGAAGDEKTARQEQNPGSLDLSENSCKPAVGRYRQWTRSGQTAKQQTESKPCLHVSQPVEERTAGDCLSDSGQLQEGDGTDSRPVTNCSQQKRRSREEGRLCEKCGEAFDDRKEMLKHRRACQNTTCHLCGKEVKFIKGHLRRRHRDLQRFACPHCPKAFPTRWHLTHHMLLHSDERPYTCEVCGMSYRGKHHLTTHLRTHSGHRPYRCTQCQAAFTRSRGLKEHMRVHTGEKPYRCEVCGRQFSNSGNFAAHRRKVHKITPLPCPSRKYVAMRETQDGPAKGEEGDLQ